MTSHKILVLDRNTALADQLRDALPGSPHRAEITSCSRVGSVADVLEGEGPFDVLVAGPSLGTRSGLARLRLIHEELPQMALVLAFNRRPEASLRDIVRAGAIDLLQLPLENDDLSDAIGT